MVIEFPFATSVMRAGDNRPVDAQIVRLDTSMARKAILEGWWSGIARGVTEEYPDREWNWPHWVEQRYRKLRRYECVALTVDSVVEGAMILKLDATSVLDEGCGAVLIELVAAAPGNRCSQANPRRYTGVGKKLVEFAVWRSVSLGLKGRVVGIPITGSIKFNETCGFRKTDVKCDEGEFFELPTTAVDGLLGRN